MSQINWDEFYNCENLDLKNSMFEEKVLSVLNSEAPLKKFQSRTMFRKWISPEVKLLMEERDRMKTTALNSGLVEDWVVFKSLRNSVVKKLKKCKKEFFSNMYDKAEKSKTTKELFRLTRELQDLRDGNAPLTLIIDGKPVRKPEQMANFQLDYYVEKIKKILITLQNVTGDPYRVLDAALEKWDETENIGEFEFRNVTLVETAKFISSLSDSTAFGHDLIDSIAIKSAAYQLIRPIQHLVNSSLLKSKFANKWKFAKLSPRLKGKECNRMIPSSYRPVAVLSTISKIVERAAQMQLLEHFEKNRLLNKSCHAYRRHLNT